MLGVPTRSDAIRISPDYAAAVKEEALARWLGGFVWAFREPFPHNHLVECYRDTENFDLLTGFLSDTQLIRHSHVPKSVVALLKPGLVKDHYLGTIQDMRTFQAEARAMLNREADLHQLITAVLDEFARAIQSAYNRERTKIGKILAMMKAAKDFRDSQGAQQVAHSDTAYSSSLILKFERDAGPVHVLYAKNEWAVEESDVALEFDERNLVVKLEQSKLWIPAGALTNPEARMEYCSLGYRTTLRRIIAQILDSKNHVTINGVHYTRALLPVDGQSVEGFVADEESYREFANLLGAPVQESPGDLLLPEAWAADEVRWVEAFATRQDPGATEALLGAYNLDGSYGNPTRQKAIDLLAHLCKPRL